MNEGIQQPVGNRHCPWSEYLHIRNSCSQHKACLIAGHFVHFVDTWLRRGHCKEKRTKILFAFRENAFKPMLSSWRKNLLSCLFFIQTWCVNRDFVRISHLFCTRPRAFGSLVQKQLSLPIGTRNARNIIYHRTCNSTHAFPKAHARDGISTHDPLLEKS